MLSIGPDLTHIIIPFLDLRLKSSHFLQNDRQDDLFQEVSFALSPAGTTGTVLTQKCFDMYSGGRHLCWR